MKRASALALSLAFGVIAVSCGRSSSRDDALSEMATEVMKQEIIRSVEVVDATLGSMQDGGGYQSWTPEKAVEKLVPLLNSANAPGEGEPDLPRSSSKIRYVRDRVTASWQIVLIPDDKQKIIRVEGYGPDTTKAVYTKKIAVSEW